MQTIALTPSEAFMTQATEIEKLRVEATQLLLEAETLNRRWQIVEAGEKIAEARGLIRRIERMIARDIKSGIAKNTRPEKTKAAYAGAWI